MNHGTRKFSKTGEEKKVSSQKFVIECSQLLKNDEGWIHVMIRTELGCKSKKGKQYFSTSAKKNETV